MMLIKLQRSTVAKEKSSLLKILIGGENLASTTHYWRLTIHICNESKDSMRDKTFIILANKYT